MTQAHASTATIERLIVGKAVDHLLQRFTALSVETGGKKVLLNESDDADTVIAAALSSDDGEAWIFTKTTPRYWVKFVLGNGCSVISDHHLGLGGALAPASALADALEA